jgi:NAD(P)-dependent dehydrogenase (short-subunit alcohol dehydrogenase family)
MGPRWLATTFGPRPRRAAVRRIEAHGGQALAVAGDVSDEEQVRSYVGQVLDAYGRIDILINNAALLGGRGLLEESLEYFNRAVTVAAAGNFLNTKHVAISMIERGIKGSIVSIISSSGWQGAPGMIAYAFHKGGLVNFVRAAAMDLAPYGIRVNSFSPTAPEPDNPEFVAERQAAGPRRPPPSPERPSWWRPTGTLDVRPLLPHGRPLHPD